MMPYKDNPYASFRAVATIAAASDESGQVEGLCRHAYPPDGLD